MKSLLFIALNCWCLCCIAQTPFTKQVWVAEPEIAVPIIDISPQANGYLWLCSKQDIYQYNGKIFNKIKDNNTADYTAIATLNNTVYVGYDNGNIARIDGHETIPVIFKNKQINSAITCIRPLWNNVLIIATAEEGIYISVHEYLLGINTQNGLSDNYVSDVAIGKNKLILATDKGINNIMLKAKAATIKYYGMGEGLPDVITTCVARATSGTIYWIGTQQSGIALYNDNEEKIIPLKLNAGWRYGQVNDIYAIDEHRAWAITDDNYLLEILRINDSISIKPKLLNTKLKKITKDKAGNLWCATNKGLLMITGLYLSALHLPSSFKLNDYTAMDCDDEGRLWFTQGRKLFEINSSNDTLPHMACVLPADITCLHTSDSNIWIGTFGGGLFSYTVSTKLLKKITTVQTLSSAHILSITEDENKIWIASFNGVDVLDISHEMKPTKHFNKHNGMGSDYVYHLLADEKHNIWMATDGGGIVLYDGQKFHCWDSINGQKSAVFYSIVADKNGNIWANSLDKGVYKFDGIHWTILQQKDGLQDQNIAAIAPSGISDLIVVTKRGIDQWHEAEHQFRHYNRRLGIGIDSFSSVLNCIANDKNGNVYIPFEDGIIMVKNNVAQLKIKPNVTITKQSLFFKDLTAFRNQFSSNENHISFTYEGISTTNPEPLQYRYKLEGYDNTWVYTKNETIPFAQLNPGKYTFRVQAALSDNFISATEDNYTFYIDKPFWQNWWFIILSVLAIMGITYIVVKKREKNILKLSQLQREKLIYEYEHLKSQINPHFLFNSFNTLVNVIEEDKTTAIDYTVHLSDFYRNMLSYKGKDLILLKEEYRITQHYIYIQKSRFGNALIIHATLDEQSLNTKKVVPFALQILIENCLKHNIVAQSSPLHIFITTNDNEITVRNNLQEKITKDISMGIGIENIRKRYALYTKRPLQFGVVNNEYIVTLPLL